MTSKHPRLILFSNERVYLIVWFYFIFYCLKILLSVKVVPVCLENYYARIELVHKSNELAQIKFYNAPTGL